jgi:hypothetical protein
MITPSFSVNYYVPASVKARIAPALQVVEKTEYYFINLKLIVTTVKISDKPVAFYTA